MIGGFGAGMAFLGALMALFMGGIGISAGADEAGGATSRGGLALLASFVGVAGAIVVRWRLRVGGVLLIVSAIAGLLAAVWFYAAGAVLLVVAGGMALWSNRTFGASR